MKTQRRSVLKSLFASVAGVVGFGAAAKAMGSSSTSEKKVGDIVYDQDKPPRFSQYTIHNGLVYIAGQGYHKEGDIKVHTDNVLKDLEDRAAARFHSTTIQAGAIAQKAGAKKLLIGHFSSKYELLDPFLEETSSVFPNTELAVEGSCFKI
ncbi:MAG: hypothetical protein EOO01_24910 [Chitinophagaceae bacterium]|nr:MAG: hypothetical protein EOO01_24910 [Chitinophagaceae bacterium]